MADGGRLPGQAGTSDIAIRAAVDADGPALMALVGRCYAGFWACVLWVDGETPYLRRPASVAAERDWRFWVAEREGRVVGSVAIKPEPGERPAQRVASFYVHPGARRQRIGSRLMDIAEADATGRGAAIMVLWSDTRFIEAHALYEARGYRRTGETRALDDMSLTREFAFEKTL
ncbi:MAG: GNAT family N-acetyltransferase [Rhodospirillaceae bacterium]|nr:GNAT family N-acetyltransferase [Rhodospirillaceae bacterium]MCA8932987.1 GNAT family N-acetyltransferase [Rhodospirillaceae bacterium]